MIYVRISLTRQRETAGGNLEAEGQYLRGQMDVQRLTRVQMKRWLLQRLPDSSRASLDCAGASWIVLTLSGLSRSLFIDGSNDEINDGTEK